VDPREDARSGVEKVNANENCAQAQTYDSCMGVVSMSPSFAFQFYPEDEGQECQGGIDWKSGSESQTGLVICFV